MPKLSIMVPVYNAAPYLHRCIDSILTQSFDDYELLLIDDGSTDDSGRICDEYAAEDARIKVFHKENGGVSSARNLGLDEAQGEWVYFVDADDEVKIDGLRVLNDLTATDVDLIFAGYERYDEQNHCVFKVENETQYLLSPEETVGYVYYAPLFGYMGYLWCKLFRLSTINDLHLRFDENIYFNEDRLFIIKYICESPPKKCIVTTRAVYKYMVRESGVMSQLTYHFNKRFITDLAAEMQMADIIVNCHFPDQISQMAKDGIVASYSRIRSCMRRNKHYDIPTIISLTFKIGIADYLKYVKMRIEKGYSKFRKTLCKNSFQS